MPGSQKVMYDLARHAADADFEVVAGGGLPGAGQGQAARRGGVLA